MGDYQTLGFKESLVYMPPKELFYHERVAHALTQLRYYGTL